VTKLRKNKMIDLIEGILNYSNPELEEKSFNDLFDHTLIECLRLDLRGPAVDMLISIKE
jgi:hypothetical protein